MIEEALFSLMKEKEFSHITVSEIVKRADVARRTFYRLYKGKEDVLHGYFTELSKNYGREYPALQYYDIRQIAIDYFGFWYQYRELLLLIHECGMDEVLYYEISRVSTEIVKNRIGDKAYKEEKGLGYWADYSTGGFILLLHRYISDGMAMPPKQYAELVSEAILKFIEPVEIK